uniref:Zinc finger protein 26 n=1 Tax=Cacopsylla melanoneura TaxID=428564 RepID=A0A8D8VYP7_9HEMI
MPHCHKVACLSCCIYRLQYCHVLSRLLWFSRFTCHQCQGTRRTGCKCDLDVFQCSLCSDTFTLKCHLREHISKCQMEEAENNLELFLIVTESGARYECPICNDLTLGFDSFQTHLKTHAVNERTVCKKPTESSLEKHVQLKHKCEYCGKELASRASLQSHINHLHLNIKENVCSVCGKSFKDRYILRNHEQIHTGEKQFICEICGKTFGQRNLLSKHKVGHTEYETFRFQCSICNKKFSRSSQWKVHVMRHSEDRPHECDICCFKFKTRSELRRHKKFVHSDVRPFQCDICGAKFKCSTTLKQHYKVHSKDRII